MPIRSLIAPIALALAAAPAMAGANMRGRPTDDFGHEFVKIGRPHNRDALPGERVNNADEWPDLGGVGHRYRIARTEVTATQWLEFVNAYDAYWVASGGSRNNSGFTSEFIHPTNLNPNGPPGYSIEKGVERSAVTMSWYMAARYCNWLHNSKGSEQAAFESGAYDTSTFGVVPGVGYFDQIEHSPGAKFWIPTLDEWTKATYYDPDRYAPGEHPGGTDGYWTGMGMQNEPLVSGPPGMGETSAGNGFAPGFDPRTIPVDAYPDIQSPWGLLNTSGGASEWVETLQNDFTLPSGSLVDPSRVIRGSDYDQGNYFQYDIIDTYPFESDNPSGARGGLRLAAAIPSPGAALPALAVFLFVRQRSRGTLTRAATASQLVSQGQR